MHSQDFSGRRNLETLGGAAMRLQLELFYFLFCHQHYLVRICRLRALRSVATALASRSPRCFGGRVARRRLEALRNKGRQACPPTGAAGDLAEPPFLGASRAIIMLASIRGP